MIKRYNIQMILVLMDIIEKEVQGYHPSLEAMLLYAGMSASMHEEHHITYLC